MTALGDGAGAAPRVAVKQACTVLYSKLPRLNGHSMQAALEDLVGPCTVEWARAAGPAMPMLAGVAQFGQHKIAMIALNAPVKQDVLDRTVAVSPMPDLLRHGLMAHRAAIRLLYVGDATEPVEQLTGLYLVAGMLLAREGLGVLNERAALAQPAELVASYLPQLGGDVPPLDLWVGTVTFRLDEDEENETDEEYALLTPGRYLIRTYGMEQFGLPELGLHMREHEEADAAYHTLINVCLYLVEGGPSLQIGAGNTVTFDKRTYLFTPPDPPSPLAVSSTGLFLLVEV